MILGFSPNFVYHHLYGSINPAFFHSNLLVVTLMPLLIDNYDSFTYNLVQYFGDLGAPCDVYRNDALTVDEVLALNPSSIVISPGPATPKEAGICIDLIHAAIAHDIPLLGICLGHQAIGDALGGNVIRAPRPVHGEIASIQHDQKALFSGIENPAQFTRYHSLIIDRKTCPPDLNITAETDGLIMAVAHKTKPLYGVQFHPESIASVHGKILLKNFLDMAEDIRKK